MSFLDRIKPKTQPLTLEDVYARVIGQPKDQEDGFTFTLCSLTPQMRELVAQHYSTPVFLTNQDNLTGIKNSDLLFLRGGEGFRFKDAVHAYRVAHNAHPAGTSRRFLQSLAAATSFASAPAENFAGMFSNGNRAMPLEQLLGNTVGFNVRTGTNEATIVDLTLRDIPRVNDALAIFGAKHAAHDIKLGEHGEETIGENKTPVLHVQLFGDAAKTYNEQYQAYVRDMKRRETPVASR